MQDNTETLNTVLVHLFNDIMSIEEKSLISGEFTDISCNDMHVISAIGTDGSKNMSAVAKELSVTTGTLTIAINNLVKKGYVARQRSTRDRRVVILSLSEKGFRAYNRHAKFHSDMINAIISDFDTNQIETLVQALSKLVTFFSERDF